jgi:hypothetical protein
MGKQNLSKMELAKQKAENQGLNHRKLPVKNRNTA